MARRLISFRMLFFALPILAGLGFFGYRQLDKRPSVAPASAADGAETSAQGTGGPPACGPGRTQVIDVYDGDTLTVQGGTRIRVLGIDTPEMDDTRADWQQMAVRARDRTRQLVFGKSICLSLDRRIRDKYNRLLAHVFTADGQWLARILIAEGLAQVYRKADCGGKNTLLRLEAEARKARSGLWAIDSP